MREQEGGRARGAAFQEGPPASWNLFMVGPLRSSSRQLVWRASEGAAHRVSLRHIALALHGNYRKVGIPGRCIGRNHALCAGHPVPYASRGKCCTSDAYFLRGRLLQFTNRANRLSIRAPRRNNDCRVRLLPLRLLPRPPPPFPPPSISPFLYPFSYTCVASAPPREAKFVALLSCAVFPPVVRRSTVGMLVVKGFTPIIREHLKVLLSMIGVWSCALTHTSNLILSLWILRRRSLGLR